MTHRCRYAACLVLTVVLSVFAPAVGGGSDLGGMDGSIVRLVSTDYMRFININGFEFDPLQGVPDLPEGLEFDSSKVAGIAYYIVQFDGPITKSMKNDLSRTGATILNYVSYNAFVVRADKATIERADDIPNVRWTGLFEPAYKLSPRLAECYDGIIEDFLRRSAEGPGAAARTAFDDRLDDILSEITKDSVNSLLPERSRKVISVEISVFEEWNLPLVLDAVDHMDGRDLIYSYQSSGVIRAEMDRGSLTQLARQPGVMWVDRYVPNVFYNDIARWVVQSGDDVGCTTPVHDYGIFGTGQTVTLGDSGIDYEHDAFEDPLVSTPGPTHRKVTDYYVPTGAGGDSSDQGSNHGTHTSGTVAGDDGVWHVYDGDQSGSSGISGPHDGQAFDAMIQVQDLSIDGYYVYPPSDFRYMYQEAMDRGSYIHTNSWGSSGAYYSTEAAQTDDFIWNNQDFLVLFSAGNDGAYAWALNPEGAAKNMITVGATGNGVSMDDVAYFSSRGPSDDGRLKPDVMAPGVDIWSANGGDPYGETDDYMQHSGTSMSTPTVAGACALIRQYYMDGWYPTGSQQLQNAFTPSAALIKATVINSANEMTGTGAYDMAQPWYPNFNQGWGRVTLDESLFFLGDARTLAAYDERTGLSTGETATYELAISDTSMPLDVTLVWSDYPGIPNSIPNLVNDLDLVIRGPDGTVYIGNQYEGCDPGESTKNPLEYDRVNNVEGGLVITDLQTGTWTIEVTGHNVPVGAQPYALVVTGGIATDKGAVSMDRNSYQSDSTVIIQVSDTGLDLDPGHKDTTWAWVSSSTEPTPENITLRETGDSTSVFRAAFALDLNSASVPGDGALQVQNLDQINASYLDEDNGLGETRWVRDFASVDDDPPVISGVTVTYLRPRACKIAWSTDEPSDSNLMYGTGTPPSGSVSSTAMTIDHIISLTPLTEDETYYFAVGSTDYAGNEARDDNGSDYYTFTTPPIPPLEPCSDEWPTYQNNAARLGLSPSDITPPLELMWTKSTGAIGASSSPIVSEGVLVTSNHGGSLRAWDPFTGDALWAMITGDLDDFSGTPTAANGVIYSIGLDSEAGLQILANDLHTGESLWRVNSVTELWDSTKLAYHDGTVFVGGYSSIFALDAEDGTLLWEQSVGSEMGVSVANGLVYTTDNVYDIAYAVDEHTGEIVWERALSSYSCGPPCVTGDTAYVLTSDGSLTAFDAFTGEEIWTVYKLGYTYRGTPVCDGVNLYFCTMDGTIFAIDPYDGAIQWHMSTYDLATNSLACANGYLYCATPYSGLAVRDTADGALMYTYPLGDLVMSSPAISEGRVWVLDYYGILYGFRGMVPTDLQVTPSARTVGDTPGSTARLDFVVENVGYSGPDTYDIELTPGINAWETELFESDGETPLTDTDGDLIIDTGPLEPYENTTISVFVTIPSDAVGGDSDTTVLRFTSSTDTDKCRDVHATALVPLPGANIGPSAYSSVDPGESMIAIMEVLNKGGLPDTIDIDADSESGWSLTVFTDDGHTLLTDSDGDDVPDVGLLEGLESATIVVELIVPTDAQPGSFDTTIIMARSSADPDAGHTASMVAELKEAPSMEWPTFRHDASRSGICPVDYELPLTHEWSSGSPDAYFYLSSPVISNRTVYYADSRGYLTAADVSSGEEVWIADIGYYSGAGYGYPGTPSVAMGMVYVTLVNDYHEAAMYAVDQDTGEVRWSYETGIYAYLEAGTPAVALGNVYWAESNNGMLFANDALTGELLWEYNSGLGSIMMGPTYWAGMVFIGNTGTGLTALNARTGDVLWTRCDLQTGCSPLVTEGILYAGDVSGVASAIDAFDGTTIWSTSLDTHAYFCSPLRAEGKVFIASFDTNYQLGRMWGLDACSGEVIWEDGVENGVLFSSPAYSNGTVYAMNSDGVICGWDADSGNRVLTYSVGSETYSSLALGDGYLVVALESGYVNAYGFKGVGVGVTASVSPELLALDTGETGTVEVVTSDVFGNHVRGNVVDWESLNGLGSVYDITEDGGVAAYVAGNVTGTDILQYTTLNLSGNITVEIHPGSAAKVVIEPASVVLAAGETVQFFAVVTDEFGNERDDTGITWSTSESAGTIDTDGTFEASTSAGLWTVTAQFGEISGSATVTILPGEMAVISADPSSASLTVGSSLTIEATASDACGNVISGVSMDWSCTAGTVLPSGDDDATAVFIAPTLPGTAVITVSAGGMEATVSVAVTVGSLDRIVLVPDQIEIRVGHSVDIQASWEDVYGNDIEEEGMEWVTDIGDLTVSADGLSAEFHAGDGSGEGVVTVSYGNETATATVTVLDGSWIGSDATLVLGLALVAAVAIILVLYLLRKGRNRPPTTEAPPPDDRPPNA